MRIYASNARPTTAPTTAPYHATSRSPPELVVPDPGVEEDEEPVGRRAPVWTPVPKESETGWFLSCASAEESEAKPTAAGLAR